MPFITGSANTFEDLRTALFNACTDNGWALVGDDDDILTKGDAVVRVTVSNTNTTAQGQGILFQGGTAVSSGALVDPSPTTPRFGTPSRVVNVATWPMTYFIHVLEDPDEVYLVANYNVDSYLWAAFGMSTVPGLIGTGLWLSAIAPGGQGTTGNGIFIEPITSVAHGFLTTSGAIFWHTDQGPVGSPAMNHDTIHTGLDGVGWAGNPASTSFAAPQMFNGNLVASTLISRLPSAWNGEAVLVPIKGYVWRASNKTSLAANLAHARYTRIDNYSPQQIISLGSDQWRIYPFYKKNTLARDGGRLIDHTGTFGWAIRYDGP